MSRERRWIRKKRFWIPGLLLVGLAGYVAGDYYEPAIVPLEPDRAWGLPCLRAQDLVIQGRDAAGDVWATRGMWAYRRRKGDDRFVRQYHIPTGCSWYWLLNLSLVRRLAHRDECVELLPLPDGAVCVMSGGHMWHRPAAGAAFTKALTLRHYGVGIGRGVFHAGLTRLSDGTILFGEYFRNDPRTDVCVYASRDSGKSWEVAHRFKPGQIQHVHAIQRDPYSDKAWICVGDFDAESMVAWTTDVGKTFHPIGRGSQVWRACQLAFTKDAVYWGADTGKASAVGIYRWDRKTRKLTKLADVPGAMFFATRLADGTIVMSTDREGARNEQDDLTRLWVIDEDDTVRSIPFGRWASRKVFAYPRFERTPGSDRLYITCHNMEPHSGDLLVIAAADLKGSRTQPETRPSTRPCSAPVR